MLDIYVKIFKLWGLPVSLIRKNLIPYINHVNKIEHQNQFVAVILDLRDQTDQIRASLDRLIKLQNRPYVFKLINSNYRHCRNHWSHTFVFKSYLTLYGQKGITPGILLYDTYISSGGYIEYCSE